MTTPLKTNTKKCRTCLKEQPAGEFYKHKTGRDGLSTQCKSCKITDTRLRNEIERSSRLQRRARVTMHTIHNNYEDCAQLPVGEQNEELNNFDSIRG